MKRFFSFMLVSVVLLCSCSFAEDADPIVASWYVLFDSSVYPELKDSMGDYCLQVYSFRADGSIVAISSIENEGQRQSFFQVAGTWSKKDFPWYECNIIGLGTVNCLISDNNSLQLESYKVGNMSTYLILRRIEVLNPYSDYVFR